MISFTSYQKLSQAKIISIVDFTKSYSHIELDEVSSFFTTFNTPFGRVRFKTMSFSLPAAGDAFQHKLYTIFHSLVFCKGMIHGVR